MKTQFNTFRRSVLQKIGVILLIIVVGYGCNDEIATDSYVTFTGDMVYSYLQKRPETYSEFIKVVNKAGLKGMLSAYGTYSCLAPRTN